MGAADRLALATKVLELRAGGVAPGSGFGHGGDQPEPYRSCAVGTLLNDFVVDRLPEAIRLRKMAVCRCAQRRAGLARPLPCRGRDGTDSSTADARYRDLSLRAHRVAGRSARHPQPRRSFPSRDRRTDTEPQSPLDRATPETEGSADPIAGTAQGERETPQRDGGTSRQMLACPS